MNRRRFIQSLVLMPLAGYIKESTASTSLLLSQQKGNLEKRELEIVPVAGFQYYQGESIWSKLKMRDTLSLKREPANQFDNNAILVKWKGEKLGYIPKINSSSFAARMDKGEQLYADIVSLSESDNPLERVEVRVYQLEQTQRNKAAALVF